MRKFQQTREVVIYCLKYISGQTLDVGAGSAKYKKIINQKVDKYVTLDIISGENVDIVGDATKMPINDASFDSVISTETLEHVQKPGLVIKEIKRVLKPGGVCFLTAPFMIPAHNDPGDYFRYNKSGLEFLFKEEGFTIIESDYYCQFWSVLSEIIHFSFFNPYKPHNLLARRLIEYIEKLAGFLDKFTKNEIVYGNVYVVAKKIASPNQGG